MNSWPTLYCPPLSPAINFKPLKVATVYGERSFAEFQSARMYVCGITPYDATHLGHAATYLTFDLVNRYLRAAGTSVAFVENITDIDDPLLERATRDNLDWQDLAASQIDLYCSDMTALRILPPDSFVPATAVMDLVSTAISKMQANGFVYLVDNDLYFDISTFLSDLPIPLETALAIFAERGGDPQRVGKRHPLDPILWLANKPGEPGWISVHGYGRPGWHIECAVIAARYLNSEDFMTSSSGNTLIELQGGGSDLIFPHHFMSAAQSKALTGKPFAFAYMHAGMVGLDGEKMSKSKGNLVFVSKLLADGVDPMTIRYALLTSHYSADRMWSNEILTSALSDISNLRESLSRELVAPTDSVISKMADCLADDLNTPAALKVLQEWHRETQNGAVGGSPGELARALDSLLGLAL